MSRRGGQPEPAPGAVMDRSRVLVPHQPASPSAPSPPGEAFTAPPTLRRRPLPAAHPPGGGHASPRGSRAQPCSHGSLLTPDGFPCSSVPRPQNCPEKGPHAAPKAVSLRAGQSAAATGPRSPGAPDPGTGNGTGSARAPGRWQPRPPCPAPDTAHWRGVALIPAGAGTQGRRRLRVRHPPPPPESVTGTSPWSGQSLLWGCPCVGPK